MKDQPLPHAELSERVVLGICLSAEDKLLDILSALTPQDFYRKNHAEIFSAIQILSEGGVAVSVISVRDQLERKSKLAQIGNAYLVELCSTVTSNENWQYHCQVLREKRIARDLISISIDVQESASSAIESPQNVLEGASNRFLELLSEKSENSTQPVIHFFAKELDREDDILQHGLEPGISTGFKSLDEILLGGFHDGRFYIIAARPSIGKTSLSLQCATHAAFNKKVPTLYFSLEMTGQELLWSDLSKRARIPITNLVRGSDVPKTVQRMMLNAAPYHDSKFYIDDTPALSTAKLRLKVKNAVARWGVKLVFVDYIQLMSDGVGRYENANAKFTLISGMMKQMAKEFRIPFVVMSQLSRGSEKDQRKPVLSDLRDCGALEQDADCVIFLHDPNFYEYGRREELSTKEIIVAKQRLGPTGSIDMGFRREFAEFVELSHVPEISSNGRAKQIAPPRYDDVPAWSEKDLPF